MPTSFIAGGRWCESAGKTGEFIGLPLTMAPPSGPPMTSKLVGADLYVALSCSGLMTYITWPRSASLDPRRPRVSRLPWRRIPMDTRTIQPYSREGGFVSTKSHVNRNHRSTEVPLSGPRMRTSGCALFWEPRGFAADRAQGWRRCTSTNHRRRRCQNGRGAGEGRKQRHHS